MSFAFIPALSALPSQETDETKTPPSGAKNASSGVSKRLISFAVKPQRLHSTSLPSTSPLDCGVTVTEADTPLRT